MKGRIKFEFQFLDFDEISLGLFLRYGNDEFGDFHMTTIGILFFEIVMYRYL
jgi:hypothetical protein